jgi:hypothetical protein
VKRAKFHGRPLFPSGIGHSYGRTPKYWYVVIENHKSPASSCVKLDIARHGEGPSANFPSHISITRVRRLHG